MSNEPEFDLEKMFLPAWAQETPSANKYAKFTGGEDRGERRRDDRPGQRRPAGFGAAGGRGPGGPGGPRGDRSGPPRRDGDRSRQGGGDRGNFRRPNQDDRREAPAPLPEINVTLLPDEKGVDSIARQIKMTGRAYPLFDIAKLILQKPERQQVKFDVVKKEDGKIAAPLFLCMLDDTLWLSEVEAVAHVLDKHFATFYQAEQTPTDPPKGVFTFVAQCGISGVILGPPNYHDYQNKLRKLHMERFSRMHFDEFKSRVKIVKDEAIVKKWLEDLSVKTEFSTLNVPEAETKKLQSREEVTKHFGEVHINNIIKQVESHTLSGTASRQLRSQPLQRLLRRAWDEQQRFPIKLVTYLSQQFSNAGIQFFKVNKTITHVAVARPHFLDMDATPVSEGVKKVVDFINANPKCTRRKLIETLAPSAPAVANEAGKPVESPDLTPEQNTLAGDLHWLIHQGHVIEFANGILETAKKPTFKPPQPSKKAAAKPAGTEGETVPSASVETIQPEIAEMEAMQPVSDETKTEATAEAAVTEEATPVAEASVEKKEAAPAADTTAPQA